MTAAETLAERRRRVIRSEIGRVAIEIFAERGYDAVTVDDIAAAAGTSQRTFFRYFASKDDVVLDYERRLHERLVAALDRQPADLGPVEALRQAYLETSTIEPADRPRVAMVGKILADTPALGARARGERSAADTVVVDRIARRLGVSVQDVRARTIVTAMGAVATAEYFAWAHDGGRGDPSARIATALNLVQQGLSSLDAARKRPASRKTS